MKDINEDNSLFYQAIASIDSGNIAELESLIAGHPDLVRNRLHNNEEGYFKDPYLLWFVADNPIKIGKLPNNIVEVTELLVHAVKRESPGNYQRQIDYTLGLVATGRIPRECGVQIAMMDLLINAGASPGSGINALANGNVEAAKYLTDRGGKMTLTLAVCLELAEYIDRLGSTADESEKLTALTAAAFYGKTDMVKRLLEMGAEPNGYPSANSGFHSHATPLHQAVSSGSLDAVKLLVEAGARLDMTDKIYDGTPIEWAMHMRNDSDDEAAKMNFAFIERYLRSKG